MKKIIFILILIHFITSCKEKDNCYPEFKGSLAYLTEYILNDESKTYYSIDIEYHIEVLESTSGIMIEHQGSLLGKIWVEQTDIDKFTNWITEKCPAENKTE